MSDATPLRGQRTFVLFWLARVCAMLAHQMLAVAVGWQVYALTGSALDLGLVGLVQFVPAFFLVLVAGYVADHFDRRHVLQLCMLGEALAALGLCLGSAGGWIDERAIFALVFVVGAARAFQMPAMQALLPRLVAPSLLARAIAANASASQAAIIIGPAVGGLLYVAGPATVYAASAALFVATGIFVHAIGPRRAPMSGAAPPRGAHHAAVGHNATREPDRPPGGRTVECEARSNPDRRQARGGRTSVRAAGITSFLAGIRYIRSRPAILGAISLDMFAVLLGGAAALLPIYARDILDTGPWGLGLLRSSIAVGGLATAWWLAHHPLRGRAGRKMFTGVAVFGVATIVFGLSRWFALSLVALAILGAADMVSVVVRQSLVQLQTPDEMRGRVSAVNSLFIGASNQLGEFESGVTAAWLGVVPSVVVGGFGTLVVVALWMRLFPALRNVDRLESAVVVTPGATIPPLPRQAPGRPGRA